MLRCLLWNVENLFLFLDEIPQQSLEALPEKSWKRLSTSIYKIKPLHQLLHMQKVIFENTPDILMMVEVGGRESLENLNRLFLKDQYQVFLIEGNSDRAIDVGYLVRKEILASVKVKTHKDLKLPNLSVIEKLNLETIDGYEPTHWKFSRDVLQLNISSGEKSYIFLLTHLKSKREVRAIDPKSRDRRRAEVHGLCEIYNRLERESPDVPIIVCGDFNGEVIGPRREEDFEQIHRETTLVDSFSLFQSESPPTFFISRGRKFLGVVLDYVLLNPKFKDSLVSIPQVKPYKDAKGREWPLPPTSAQKQTWPSDHLPILFEVD